MPDDKAREKNAETAKDTGDPGEDAHSRLNAEGPARQKVRDSR
jgi:hypothetical protein